jgi:myosin-5
MQQARDSAERGERDYPHLYAVVAEAYLELRKGRNQVLVISGESGSGKTENTKHSLRMLDWLGGGEGGEGGDGGSGVGAIIGACNYVLEVFGNAQTVKNDNSSRFGKYLRVQMGSRREVVGASIDCYLLEKSRVVSWGPLERTFHVFYLQSDSHLPLPDSNFPFARQALETALSSIGLGPAEIQYIWNILEVITRLRRMTFSDAERRVDESRACSVREREELRAVGGLLRMEEKQLERFLLLEERVVMKEKMEVVLSKPHCEDNRNTFCKSLYGEVFELLLRRMAKALRGEGHTSSVNILDIFGF